MTMQNDENRHRGFLESATGQVMIVAIIVVVFVSMVLHLLWNASVAANGRTCGCNRNVVVVANVRFGSLADILRCGSDVRFAPESGH